MNWRFRQSFTPLPGVRITLSRSGISTSVGVGPFRVTAGPRGAHLTTRLPGTGISFQQSLGGSAPTHLPKRALANPLPETGSPRALQGIQSAGTDEITSLGLSEFKKLLESAKKETREIKTLLDQAKRQEREFNRRYVAWRDGWLMRRIAPKRYANLAENAANSSAFREELEEQERLSVLQTQIDIPEAVQRAYARMRDDFSRLSQSNRIWDTVGERATNRVVERTIANRVIDRKPVVFQMGRCDLIESDWQVPHLGNANGGDIFLYPAFIIYFVSADSFALLEYREVALRYTPNRFIEEESIPSDSTVLDHTWAKANKDGSPDRRFKGNHQIPIVQYGQFTLTSSRGMNEEYMVSNAANAELFYHAWCNFVATINS